MHSIRFCYRAKDTAITIEAFVYTLAYGKGNVSPTCSVYHEMS